MFRYPDNVKLLCFMGMQSFAISNHNYYYYVAVALAHSPLNPMEGIKLTDMTSYRKASLINVATRRLIRD